MHSLHRNFSHIYVEEGAFDYPDTQEILDRFPKSTVIRISNYKEIFNRSRQNWSAQKESQKLILAVKKDGFLYRGSAVTPDFGHRHFFYNSLIMNCLYDCHYCYLQGMYPSANVVIFVNNSDYVAHTLETLSASTPLYLCLSYDSDLLAFEGIVPYCRRWIELVAQHPDLQIEIRTKSSNFSAIADLAPRENVILAWTLSPDEIARKYESGAPGLLSRLTAARRAIDAGWQVRLCLDPILRVDDWQSIYRDFIAQLATALPLNEIRDISLGVFRINSDFFKRMKKQRPHSLLMYDDYEKQNGLVTYSPRDSAEIRSFVAELLKDLVATERIFDSAA